MPRIARRLVAFVCAFSVLTTAAILADEGNAPAAQTASFEAISKLKDRVLLDLTSNPITSPPGTAVSVEVHGNNLDTIRDIVVDLGGAPYGEVPGFFVEATVPIDRLDDLAGHAAVTRVARVTRTSSAFDPIAPNSLQDGRALQQVVEETLQFSAWHDAGHKGAGQRIGILDVFGRSELENAIATGRVPSPAGVFCRNQGTPCSITEHESAPHGVGVAEIIHRVAPDAGLYLATVYTLSDLSAAIDWFAAQGVSIINRSETSEFDGPGDGSGPVGSLVDRAIEADMVWVAAAGNAGGDQNRRGQNWIGTFTDANGDGVHEWGSGNELMEFECGFLLGMRWDDWAPDLIATDYDLWIFDEPGDDLPEVRANDVQTATDDPPIEHMDPICQWPGDQDYMMIVRFEDRQPDGDDEIQIMGNFTPMEEWDNAGSATGPGADSANPGAITVGATLRPNSAALAGYSSQGPTRDGRVNPDLLGPSCLPVTNFPGCFSGTSSSAPFVAGTLAMLRGAGVFSAATEVDSLIAQITIDQGRPGLDSQYGHGSLHVEPPSFFGVLSFDELCQGKVPTIVGTAGADVIEGTNGPDIILAGAGDDIIRSGAGADVVCGGEGRDIIRGGGGADLIDGGPQRDRIWGETGADTIAGGGGPDRIFGNVGQDTLRGEGGNDRVTGGAGDDALRGGAGSDQLVGAPGADTLHGGVGIDRCAGAALDTLADAGDVIILCES